LGVVDRDEQRRRRRLFGQHLERRQADQEELRGPTLRLAERRHDRIALGRGQVRQPVEQRLQELMESGECEAGLRLGSCRGQDAEPVGASGLTGFRQQGRLADPGIAADDQCVSPLADILRDTAKDAQLEVTAEQGHGCRQKGEGRSIRLRARRASG